MKKLTLVETKAVTDGSLENPIAKYEISLEKGVDSAINTLAHKIHQLGTQFALSRTKGMSVSYSLVVDDIQTSIVFSNKVGLTIKEKSSEAYLKEAGLKKLTLSDFTIDYTAFCIAHPAITNVIKYHLGVYMEGNERADIYKATAKTFFKNDVEGKADLVSWSVQTKSAVEKTLYGIQDLMKEANADNTDKYLDEKRASAAKSIEFKKEQRKLEAEARKLLKA